jgi:hypothetical protein
LNPGSGCNRARRPELVYSAIFCYFPDPTMPLFRRLPLPAMAAIAFALMSAIAWPGGGAAASMKLADYVALSGPAPHASFRYGSAPSQYAELFLPPGAGPFPVAVLVHRGSPTPMRPT